MQIVLVIWGQSVDDQGHPYLIMYFTVGLDAEGEKYRDNTTFVMIGLVPEKTTLANPRQKPMLRDPKI